MKRQYGYEVVKREGFETEYIIRHFKSLKERNKWVEENMNRYPVNSLSPIGFLVRKHELPDYTIIPQSELNWKEKK